MTRNNRQTRFDITANYAFLRKAKVIENSGSKLYVTSSALFTTWNTRTVFGWQPLIKRTDMISQNFNFLYNYK